MNSCSSPTGTVQFFDGAASLGTATMNTGLAKLAVNTPAVCGHSITASDSGDANNLASTSSHTALTVTAGQVGDGDVPLPFWALLLGGGLAAALRRRLAAAGSVP